MRIDTSNPVHLVLVACLAAIPSTILGTVTGAWAAMWRHKRRVDRIERWMETVVSANLVARVGAQEVVVADHRRDIEELGQHAAEAREASRTCMARRQKTEDAIYRLLDEISKRTARIEGYLEGKAREG